MRLFRTLFSILFFAVIFQACQPKIKYTALNAIPSSSPIVVEIHDLKDAQKLLSSTEFLTKSLALADVKQIDHLVKNVFAAVNIDPQSFKPTVYAYANLAGAYKYNWVICTSIENLKEFKGFQFSSDWQLERRNYDNGEILIYTLGEEVIYALNHKNIIAASLNENLIEEIIRLMNSGRSIENDLQFMEHRDLATETDPLTIYVNFAEIGGLAKTVLILSKPNWLENFGTWAELDINEEEGNILMNGASVNADSTNSFLSVFKQTGSTKITAAQIVPSNAVGVVFMGSNNFLAYKANHDSFLKNNNLFRAYKQKREALGFDLNNNFYPFIDEEFGVIYTETKTTVAKSKMAYLKIKEPQKLLQNLMAAADGPIENYREFPIYKLNKSGFLPTALGRAFNGLDKPYFILHENWLIFANEILVLKNAVNDYKSGKTWSESEGYKSIANRFSSKANIWTLFKNPGAHKLAMAFMDEKEQKTARKNKDILTAADWVGVQIKNKGEANIISVYAGKQAEATKEANQVWSLQMDAPVKGAPQFIYNHNNQRNEIVVQDQNNQLYWIDGKGKIIWKKQLDGEILGEIKQIDLYQNNRLQLAFTTTQKFYVVDRLGRDVAPFPIALSENITAPLAVFDYDKSRNYRFLVCAGKRVYNYNKDGQIVKGWEFKKAKSEIVLEPRHYVLGGKDYIFIAEQNGKVNVLNRKGERRIKLKQSFKIKDRIYLQTGASISESRLVTANNQHLNYLFLNDKKDSVELDLEAPATHFVFDGKNMVFSGGNWFTVKEQTHPFEVESEEVIELKPVVFTKKGNSYFSFTTANDQIQLYNQNGELLSGFPVYGNSRASVGSFTQNGSLYLVGGTPEGSLFLYRIVEE